MCRGRRGGFLGGFKPYHAPGWNVEYWVYLRSTEYTLLHIYPRDVVLFLGSTRGVVDSSRESFITYTYNYNKKRSLGSVSNADKGRRLCSKHIYLTPYLEPLMLMSPSNDGQSR